MVTGDALRAELDYQKYRVDRSPETIARLTEIDSEVDDILTPFFDGFSNEAGVSSELVRLASLMETAGHYIVPHYKEKYKRARPHVVDSRIDPSITVPNHYAYPSGHALQSYLIAFALCDVMGDFPKHVIEFMDTVARVSENREFSGVHYPSDSQAGESVARAVFPMLKIMFGDVFANAVAA